MSEDPHVKTCKICSILSSLDIVALETAVLERQDNYETISGKYSAQYEHKITKQNISQHMKWFRNKEMGQVRADMRAEQKDKLLDTMEEFEKIHRFLWDKIQELESIKNKTGDINQQLRLYNAQDRYLKTVMRGLRLLAELRGEADRDSRKISIDVVLKDLRAEFGVTEDE